MALAGISRRATLALFQPSRHLVVSGCLPLKPWVLPKTVLHRRRPCVFPFSTAVAKPSAVTKPQAAASQKIKWRVIARIAYYVRIPFLVLSVYGIGYQQGIMDYSRDPEDTESKLLDTVLSSVGCTSPEDREKVLIAREGEWRHVLSKLRANHSLHHSQDDESYDETQRRMVMMQNASMVGEKIVKVAQSYANTQLMNAIKESTDRMPPEVLQDNERVYEALLKSDEVFLWNKAQKHMEGPWRFVLIPSHVPNAFVSEILPRRIFITTSLFEQFIESQDELALVLGHEISHLILGHSSDQNALQAGFRTVEILLLSLDPTEGLLSLAFMTFLASVRNAIGAVYSRDNERCADELGIKLTAMACYDTRAAARVFYKMHLQNVESGKESSSNKVGWGGLFSFFDSHPPSEERFRTLLEESGEENREKYEETSCASLKKVFLDALKPSDKEGR
ncbi:hypothetical protein ACHAXR_003900 [Thalassiosira sp. AJA248-18]